MPPHIKIALSALVLAVAGIVYTFRGFMSPNLPEIIVPALAIFMVVSLWVFPETSKREK